MFMINSMIVSSVPKTRYYIIQQPTERVTKSLKAKDIFVKNVRQEPNAQKTASLRKP